MDNSRDSLGRRMSPGLNRDPEIGSAFREVVPGSSHLPELQVMSSPTKDSEWYLLIQIPFLINVHFINHENFIVTGSRVKSQQASTKKDQINEQLESKPLFNPLSIDVEHSHSHSSELYGGFPQINTLNLYSEKLESNPILRNSSPSMNDDLTPTGNSPHGIASQAHLEPSPLVTNGVINRNNQDTILRMQSLGILITNRTTFQVELKIFNNL